MSIDLEWHKLDSSLSKTLVDILNRQLSNTPRPSFIGPVEITGFDFGTHAPDVELVDLRDIHRDFLEDDDSDGASEQDNVKVTERAQAAEEEDEEDGFEWVSRRAARRGLAEDALAYHHLPPHVRYGRGPAVDLFASTPALYPGSPRDMWGAGGTGMGAVPVQRNRSMPSLGDVRPAVVPRPSSGMYHPGPLTSSPMSGSAHESASSSVAVCHPTTRPVSPSPDASSDAPPEEQQARPDLQLHLHLNWHSNLRLTLTTSLLINYPSPSFMSLPIKLSVTGLVFNGEVAVAYEGSRERVHICILDELDPYGPACRRERSQSSTPSDIDDDTGGKREGKRLPVGQRLLPSIFIESEIGQADKHVLKNVTRVERFIQDVIRKTVEEELVFPNFHTLVMGDQSR
ncbi:hypothetical protein L210DRAFT_3526920 [Boletus edulis BED1]|uniref:Mitochondrial distribution and morphology protein 12 n=1 Tax=Boletus edulis BED1 TaxID=1328754 RepID=A0AAD4C397_BOLED|nr:hypothetical protein L210DRAFT_3526920 [Boletus edulis BED1]